MAEPPSKPSSGGPSINPEAFKHWTIDPKVLENLRKSLSNIPLNSPSGFSPRASTAPQEPTNELQGEVAGGSKRKAKASTDGGKPHRATGFDKKPGRREMKEFPLTSKELWMLGGLQLGSALSFTGAGSCFGLWLNQKMATSLSNGVDGKLVAFWDGVGFAALGASIVLGMVGIGLFAISGMTVHGIMKETSHAK